MPAILAWLGRLLPVFFEWLLRAAKSFRGMWFGLRLGLIVLAAALMPLPDWLEDLPSKLGALPAPVLFFAEMFQVRFGIVVIFSALVLRWIWREMSKSI